MAVAMKRVSDDVCSVLAGLDWDDDGCQIQGQLDRKLYQDVNKVLENFGGKWNKKAKRHLFESPEDARLGIMETAHSGEFVDIRKTLQFFPTPEPIVDRLISFLTDTDEGFDLNGKQVLEPSAGKGNIVLPLLASGASSVICVEINKPFAEGLSGDDRVIVHNEDFMEFYTDRSIEAVVMNPPFTRGQDMDHVRRAYDMLYVGGCLVAIMSLGYTFRNDKRSVEFRAFLDRANDRLLQSGRRVATEEIEVGAFSESGTNIRTQMIRIPK